MNSNLVWENNPLLYKEFDNLIKNENSNGKKNSFFYICIEFPMYSFGVDIIIIL